MTSILYDLSFVTDVNYLTLASNICKTASQDQQITKSVFQISPQPEWQIEPWLFNRKVWHIIKSWYTDQGPEQGFQRWLTDGLNV